MKYIIAILFSLFAITYVLAEHEESSLLHTKGHQSLGARYGKGTKNRFDIGLEYQRCFSPRTGLLCQLDMEKASFGNSEFTNQFLLGAGLEIMCFHPTSWMFIDLNLIGNVGYDSWSCEILDAKKSGIVGGANIGGAIELYPTNKVSVIIGGQQYLLFGNGTNYLKPNFYLGIRYVWYK